MTKSLIEKRTSRLPWCHAAVAVTLIVTASVGLCFSLLALFQPIRDCPVLNTQFVIYWFYASVEILQLVTGITLLGILIGISCRRQRPPRRSLFTSQLIGTVGGTAHFLTFRSNSTGVPPNRHVATEGPVGNSPFYHPKTGMILCCGKQRRCIGRISWLQLVLFVTGVVLIGQVVALVWASTTHRQITSPQNTFESQLIGLFVEAKIQVEVHLFGKTNSLTSAQCWDMIQKYFHCCGSTTYTDWSGRNLSLANGTQVHLPESCFCQAEEIHCHSVGAIPYAHGVVYSRGCTKPVSRRLQTQLLSLIVIIPISVVLILMAFLYDVLYTLRTAQLVLQQQSGT